MFLQQLPELIDAVVKHFGGFGEFHGHCLVGEFGHVGVRFELDPRFGRSFFWGIRERNMAIQLLRNITGIPAGGEVECTVDH